MKLMRVLVVDDCLPHRRLLTALLGNAELFTMLWNALILSIAAALEALVSEECARWRRQTKDQEMSEPPTGG